MFAWIGMKYNGKEYKWVDGMDTQFDNWSDEAVRVGVDPCAKMSLLGGMIGKWVDSSCKSKALIVCQRKPEINLNLLKDIIQNMSNIIDKQQGQISSLIPMDFLYTQLPNQSSPEQLWSYFIWTEVTEQYSGLFFRAEGSGSELFGEIQQANHSWISEIGGRCHNWNYGQGKDYTLDDYRSSYSLKVNQPKIFSCPGKSNAIHSLSLFTSTREVRPKNTAIKIWKRIQ